MWFQFDPEKIRYADLCSQDEFGIVYEIQIKGKRAKSFPEKYVAQTIIFQCFYPLAKTPYDDLPTDLKSFVDETYVIGSQSMQFRKMGNLTSEFMVSATFPNKKAE